MYFGTLSRMDLVAAGLASALAVLLVAVQPFAGRKRYRRLLARLAIDPTARLAHYRSGIIVQWTIVGLVVVIGLLGGRRAASIGLQRPGDAWDGWWPVLQVGVLLVVSTIVMRRPSMRAPLRRQASGFLALLPSTTHERQTFAGLAITAGTCEEIVYRGFLMAYLSWLLPGVTSGWIVVLSAVAFGLAHAYQGPRGIVLTGIVGATLGALVVASGSLLPAIAVHALVDLRILALPDLSLPDSLTSPAPAAATT
jgi:membrane protease YdiL (CAAX protease family)